MQRLITETVLPFQWKILCDEVEGATKSHCVENFRIAAGEKTGEYYGLAFQDSDLAKWLEAVAYALEAGPNEELSALADEMIALIGRAQQADGYLNTYYTLKEPGRRFTNLRDDHELYCAGHMMEAAVAYYEATGKRALLDIMMDMARLIDREFGLEAGKRPGVPGHPEIELALMRMYRATGEASLYKLARSFIDMRGRQPNYFDWEEQAYHSHRPRPNPWMEKHSYCQSHLPVREQEALDGHSVRALYLLSGMIDVAAQSRDPSLVRACHTLYDSVVERRMYVTGGVGSTVQGEAFTLDYDLPNDTVYAETCAAIALVFASRRMFTLEPDARYADVIERALYNGCLAGMGQDGQSFFYVNPLQADPRKSKADPGKEHVLCERPKWFGCACCPPNLARLVLSIGRYIYEARDSRVYLNQFIAGTCALELNGGTVTLTQETDFPVSGDVTVRMDEGAYALCVRLPAWSGRTRIWINGREEAYRVEAGYAVLERDWARGDVVLIELDMRVRRVYAHPSVSEDAGLVALQRGPLVYCLEQADNGGELHRVAVGREAVFHEAFRPELLGGVVCVSCDGFRMKDASGALYRYDAPPAYEPARLSFIPYYAWANRGEGEMRVWVREV